MSDTKFEANKLGYCITSFGCFNGRCLLFEMVVTSNNLDFVYCRAGAEVGSEYVLAILGFLTYTSHDFDVRHDVKSRNEMLTLFKLCANFVEAFVAMCFTIKQLSDSPGSGGLDCGAGFRQKDPFLLSKVCARAYLGTRERRRAAFFVTSLSLPYPICLSA